MNAAPVMLLDSASLYFRAFFGVSESVVGPTGRPVNAIRGLLDFITRLTKDFAPADVIACWDNDWRPDWRVQLVPSYKAHRVADSLDSGEPVTADARSNASALDDVRGTGEVPEEVPDLLAEQVPVIADVLSALGLGPVGAAGFEADDVLATLARQQVDQGQPVLVVTGDRDLFQLVGGLVRVVYTARSVTRPSVVDDSWLLAKYGVEGRAYRDFSALRGDASDGLPGISGVGEKTAAKLIGEYGAIPQILAAAADPASVIRPKLKAALLDGADYLGRAQQVVTARSDVPITADRVPADAQRAAQLGQLYGLGSSMSRVLAALPLR